jgi:hypothetical protein
MTLYKETGKTPQQIAEINKELVEALKIFVANEATQWNGSARAIIQAKKAISKVEQNGNY